MANPKYTNVKATVDTGKTMRLVSFLTDGQVARRKGELFGRISMTKLYDLLKEESNKESVFELFDNLNPTSE